jgi:branched-chain amino acid transport system substrate-binding protein
VVDRSVPALKVRSRAVGAATRNKREVRKLKKILYLIMMSLLVLGLVLAGCGGAPSEQQEEEEEEEEFTDFITFAVCGPMTFIQGQDHWAGAEMARDEINAAGGIDVGGTAYGIELIQVETNEIMDLSGADGVTALSAVIDDVDFCIGGFRTEALLVYREVAMNAQKIFIDDGAATTMFCASVYSDYDKYKYFFKGTPYNEVFLVTQALKQLGAINSVLSALKGPSQPEQLRLSIIMEDAAWCNPMLPYIAGTCPALGIDYKGVQKCASNADDLSAELTALAADDPHIVFTILSGPPGKAYGAQQSTYLPNAFSMGINVESQDIDYHEDTGAEYHCTLDTWADGVALTDTTLEFFDDFVARTGRYPTYCAATHDNIYGLMEAIESVGLDTDAIIEYMEDFDNAYTGTAATTVWFSDIVPYDETVGYLSFDQAMDIFPHLPALYGLDEATLEANWVGYALGVAIDSTSLNGFTTSHGFLPHDTVYGPGLQTGQGVQWQEVGGEWKKVGWWPFVGTEVGANKAAVDLNETEVATLKAAGLLDKYGNWNFAYPGSVPVKVPPQWVAAFGS